MQEVVTVYMCTEGASFPGHSQISSDSRSCGENSSFLHSYEIKSGSGLGTRLHRGSSTLKAYLAELFTDLYMLTVIT